MTDSNLLLTVAVLGGTGKEGKGLAYRWARAGYRVLIGSRSAEKAIAAADEITGMLGEGTLVKGLGNLEAAREANIAVLTVPYAAHRDTLEMIKEELKGKILVDVTVPLVPPKVSTVQMPAAGSAAQEAHCANACRWLCRTGSKTDRRRGSTSLCRIPEYWLRSFAR